MLEREAKLYPHKVLQSLALKRLVLKFEKSFQIHKN